MNTHKPELSEAHNWPEDYNDENGNYVNNCIYCERGFKGHKYRRICKLCDAGSIEYWTKLSQAEKPKDNNCAHAGCWSHGEMTGFARCMVKEVFPLRERIKELEEEVEMLKNEKAHIDDEFIDEMERLRAENAKLTALVTEAAFNKPSEFIDEIAGLKDENDRLKVALEAEKGVTKHLSERLTDLQMKYEYKDGPTNPL
jgi:hypothetical protein